MQHLLEQKLLPFVIKPGRYIGGELGQIVKNPEDKFKIALGYPDLYEVGMSHVGLHILYHMINSRDGCLCERFFAPDRDAEQIMRRERLPMFTLESSRPLAEFDLVGFALAYEMVFSNVLNILELAGIPLRALARTDEHPLVVGGGPAVHNPEPMAPFFDFFFIGEIEEVLDRVLEILAETASQPRPDRLERLAKEMPSVYVPRFYDETTHRPLIEVAPEKIRSRKTTTLKREYYPARPLVPFIETVHDRLAVEIMRGCPRGCRFCQASAIYKPVRLRQPDDIISQIEEQLRHSGYDEVSLLSLSSSDYPQIGPLITKLAGSLAQRRIALALPSLRPGTFTQELADAIKATRKTGLTFAPEAGTERLRAVIRKDITDQELYDTIRLVFDNGWHLVKLYFMIGLPTETDEDIEGIVEMIGHSARIGREIKGRNIINVTISPFSPKPHTPFQWDAQATPEEIREKGEYIKRRVGRGLVNVKLRDPDMPFLEGIIGRGGRELAPVIEAAFRAGARFDGWSENLDTALWLNAFADHGLEPREYLKERSFADNLPWSHIEVLQSAEYLARERNRTAELLRTPGRAIRLPEPVAERRQDDNAFGRSRKKLAAKSTLAPTKSKVRIKWGRRKLTRFLSHLDNARVFERAIRRAGLPVEYTQGFHPHMKISFGPPLQLGYTSEGEYFDLTLERPFQPDMADLLAATLPDGFLIIYARPVIDSKKSLSSRVNRALYEVAVDKENDCREIIGRLMDREMVEVVRSGKNEERNVDIRPAVYKLEYRPAGSFDSDRPAVYMELGVGTGGYARPSEVMTALEYTDERSLAALSFHRLDLLFVDEDGHRLTPLEF